MTMATAAINFGTATVEKQSHHLAVEEARWNYLTARANFKTAELSARAD